MSYKFFISRILKIFDSSQPSAISFTMERGEAYPFSIIHVYYALIMPLYIVLIQTFINHLAYGKLIKSACGELFLEN